jgi:hypothetical protein
VIGSNEGLKGFKIKNAVQFYGKLHDSGIWHHEQYDFWTGQDINIYFSRVEDIEINE